VVGSARHVTRFQPNIKLPTVKAPDSFQATHPIYARRVFEHLGSFPSPCSPSSTCSLLDERTLLHYADSGSFPESLDNLPMWEATESFRYFGLHNGLLLGISEQKLQQTDVESHLRGEQMLIADRYVFAGAACLV